MLSACQWVYEGIHLGAVTNRMLDLTKGVADAVGGNDSVSHGCSSVASQHTKSGRLTSTIHTKQTKTLGKGEVEGGREEEEEDERLYFPRCRTWCKRSCDIPSSSTALSPLPCAF